MKKQRYGSLFRSGCQLIKYTLLILFGFTMSFLFSSGLGVMVMAQFLLDLGPWILRLVVFSTCFMVVATVAESLRS